MKTRLDQYLIRADRSDLCGRSAEQIWRELSRSGYDITYNDVIQMASKPAFKAADEYPAVQYSIGTPPDNQPPPQKKPRFRSIFRKN